MRWPQLHDYLVSEAELSSVPPSTPCWSLLFLIKNALFLASYWQVAHSSSFLGFSKLFNECIWIKSRYFDYIESSFQFQRHLSKYSIESITSSCQFPLWKNLGSFSVALWEINSVPLCVLLSPLLVTYAPLTVAATFKITIAKNLDCSICH